MRKNIGTKLFILLFLLSCVTFGCSFATANILGLLGSAGFFFSSLLFVGVVKNIAKVSRANDIMVSRILSSEIQRLRTDAGFKEEFLNILMLRGFEREIASKMTEEVFKDISYIDGCRRLLSMKAKQGSRIDSKFLEKYTQKYVNSIMKMSDEELNNLHKI